MEDKSNGTDPPSPAQTPTNGLDTRSPKLLKQSLSLEEPHIRDSFPIHKHNESRPFPSSLCHDLLFEDIFTKFPKKSTISWRPLEMDPGDIWPTTGGFLGRDLVGEEEMGNKRWYGGEVQMRQKTIDVIVKTYRGGFEGEMEMEMELWASTATFHRNLMSLMGFCKDPPSLVFAYDGPGTLDQLLTHPRGKSRMLLWSERMTIAIEIGRCIRYLHEECTEGPLVHGNLQPCNIFLSRDLKPMISSIKYTRQLQREKSESSHERTPKSFKTRRDHGGTEDDEVAEEHQHMTPKLDVYSFGVLLLRLFCRGFQDERELLQWARPLLARHAFHELLDGRLEGCDTYELYRVMLTAAACISLPPLGRPTITQVVSMLESKNSSILTPSPSSSCQSPAKV